MPPSKRFFKSLNGWILIIGVLVALRFVAVASIFSKSSLEDQQECSSVTTLYADDLDLKIFRDSKSNANYYRYLTVDLTSNYLFVGAMNRIFGLYLKDIENSAKSLEPQTFYASTDSQDRCRNNGHQDNPECQNHIRFLLRNASSDGNEFYMCSTGAYSPIAYQLKLRNDRSRFDIIGNAEDGRGICPFDPSDNYTALYMESGTPGDVPSLFGGTPKDFVGTQASIYRPPIYRGGYLVADYLQSYDVSWLNEPQFVGSFDLGNHVYFFYREVALEYTNCGKKIYSRVARVCKNDEGGQLGLLRDKWVSFIKARLNCSIPGEYPYYFDEIQDVYRIGSTFYALFTTNVNGLTASAICSYSLENIDRAFDGTFKHGNATSLWLPVPLNEVPNPRPSDCQSRSNKRLQDQFVSQHSMLMDKAVSHTYGRPIFFKGNSLMRKMVAIQNVAGKDEMVFFTASNTGMIYKIATWLGLTKIDFPRTYLVTTYVPMGDNYPIWDLTLNDKWIYFGTDMAVGQISVETCDKYTKIDLCIYDPFCGWDSTVGECRSNHNRNLISYKNLDLHSYTLEEAIMKEVGKLYIHEKVSKITGSSATLRVAYRLHISGNVHWTQNGSTVKGDRHILAKDNSLIITEIRKSDEGRYIATDNLARQVAEYSLIVETDKEQIEQRWMRKFDQWCDEFERYQEDIRQWEKKCTSCCEESARANMVPAIGGP